MVQAETPDDTGVEHVDFGAQFASGYEEAEEASKLPLLGPTTVKLPSGVTAIVRELNGLDEEQLTRAEIKRPIDFLDKVITIGVTEIDGQKFDFSVLQSLLLGDRDSLVVGIRRATFGDDLEYKDLTCPNCSRDFSVRTSLDEIPVKELEGDREFKVPLMRGGEVTVRLATHGDQLAMLAESERVTEQNTVLLSRTVTHLGETPLSMVADAPEDVVKKFNMRDRQAILNELQDRQPGPDFGGVKITCPACEYEDRLIIDLVGMFRI